MFSANISTQEMCLARNKPASGLAYIRGIGEAPLPFWAVAPSGGLTYYDQAIVERVRKNAAETGVREGLVAGYLAAVPIFREGETVHAIAVDR